MRCDNQPRRVLLRLHQAGLLDSKEEYEPARLLYDRCLVARERALGEGATRVSPSPPSLPYRLPRYVKHCFRRLAMLHWAHHRL